MKESRTPCDNCAAAQFCREIAQVFCDFMLTKSSRNCASKRITVNTRFLIVPTLVFCSLFFVTSAQAGIAHDALSVTVPLSMPPAETTLSLAARDFRWVPVGGSPELPADIHLEWVEETLEWIRVRDVLLLPRVRLRVKLDSGLPAVSRYQDYVQPLEVGKTNEMVVALLTSGDNQLVIEQPSAGGKLIRYTLKLEYVGQQSQVWVDPSCSRFLVEGSLKALQSNPKTGWAYVGCRLVQEQAWASPPVLLEIYVLWDGVGEKLDGFGPAQESVWVLRVRSQPGHVTMPSMSASMDLSYRVPPTQTQASFSMGVGPYSYKFKGLGYDVAKYVALPTFYAAYFLNENAYLVAFSALVLDRPGFTDTGVYLRQETARIFDKRLKVNVLLGMHVIAMSTHGQLNYLPSAPQGVEFIYADAGLRRANFALGAFIYPQIGDKSYYNVWVRWGKRTFLEFNYLSLEEKINGASLQSSSVGLTLGFPIANFL